MTTTSHDHSSRTLAVEGGDLPVRLYLPAAGSGPGVVVVQEIFGVSRYIEQRALDLAAFGFVVAVPELYWRLGLVATPESGDDVLEQAMGAARRLGLEQAIADTRAVVEWLPGAPEVTGAVAVLGFCFGGGVASAVAATASSAPAALVSYYGSALPALVEQGLRIDVPSLHHWGDADAFIPFATQDRVHQALGHDGVAWHTYPGAGHAFDNPNPAFHDAAASALAWERTTAFLAALPAPR